MKLLKSIAWISIGQIVKIFTNLVATFYLTILIPPSEYGLIAMCSIVINFALIFNDLGLSAAIIRAPDLTQSLINRVYRINIFCGILLMTIVMIMSGVISDYFDESKLKILLIILSLSFPISSLGTVHKASIEKKQLFKTVVKIESTSSVCSLILAILLANLNFGAISLVVQTVSNSAISSLLFIMNSKIKTRLSNVDGENTDLIGFSGNITLFNVINYATRNMDVLLVGKYFSSAILGAYSLSYKIMMFPLQSMTFVINRAFLPHFSNNLNDIDKNRHDYMLSLKVISAITSFLMLSISCLSHEIVNVFLSKEWYLVSDILEWMAPSAILQSVISTTGGVFIAYAKTRWLFFLGCFGAILMSLTFIIGVHFDIIFFAKLYLISNIINLFPCLYFVGKILKYSIHSVVFMIFRQFLPAFFMFSYGYFIKDIFPLLSDSSFMMAFIFSGFFVWVAGHFIINNHDFNYIYKFFFEKMKSMKK